MLIDILVGILLALGVTHIFNIPPTGEWILLGAIFALLPDIDFIFEFIKRGTVGGKKLGAHRVLTHIPLLFVLPAALLYVFFGAPVTALFTLCIIWHFVHDSNAMGYGNRLLWPFSKRFYKFFSDKQGNYQYNWSHILVSWSKSEVEALHAQHGNDAWIQDHLRHHATRWSYSLVLLLQSCILIFLLLLIVSFILLFV